MRQHRLAVAIVATALTLTACATEDEATDDMAMDGTDEMEDMDGMDMVMSEPDAPRADEVEADELRVADFIRFDDVPERFADAGGSVAVAFTDQTFVTIDLTGLPPGEEMIAHLHAQPCAVRGGPHFQFVEGGAEVPPNEVHLAGTPGDDGTLTVKVTNDQAATAAEAVVFHPRADTATYVACADIRPETSTVDIG